MARIERITEIPMLILAFVYVVVFVVSYIRAVPLEIRQDARFVEDLIIVAFAAELILKVAVADRRFEYLRHRWLDMIIVVVPFLRPLRLLVVLPMVARALVGLNRLMSSYQGAYALLAALLTVFTGAGLLLVFERDVPDSPIQSFGDALWWAMTTITTVGYGDTYPVTPQGRGLAVVVMVIGIALFGMMTAAVAAYFVETASEEEEREQSEKLDEILARLNVLEQRLKDQGGYRNDATVDRDVE